MPEERPKLIDRFEPILRRFGYVPVRESSQTIPELAESSQWEDKPAKTVDYLETYEKAIWTYAAVYRIATSAAKVPFRIYKKRVTKNGKRIEQIDKLVNYVLEIPNPYTTRFDLWEATLAFAELTGNSYWELVSEGDKPPGEIYVLRPDHLKINPSKKELIESYTYDINGRDIRLLPEDILHFKYFSSKSELYGTSANTAAEKSIILDLYSLDFNARFFRAGARILGVLETDRHLSDKAMKRLNAKWIGKYGGYQKAFKTPVLEEGLKYKGITSTHQDMEFIQQRKITREEILAAYGVHPAIVGLFEYSNYANAEAQKKLFWEDTMAPKLKKLQENVTSFLLPRYGSRLIGEFDLSVIEALQESEETKQKISCGLTDSGIMTANEVRDKFYQMDKVPGGDKRTIRGKYVVVEDTNKSENDKNPEDESPGDGEDVGDGDNFDFSKAELEDLIVSLRKRFKKRIEESR